MFGRITWAAAGIICVCVLWLSAPTSSLRFNIEPYKDECLKEDLRPQALVIGEYSSTYFPGMRLRFWIEDPWGEEIYEHIDNGAHKNRFSFTTASGGEFAFCFHDMQDSEFYLHPWDYQPEDYEDYDLIDEDYEETEEEMAEQERLESEGKVKKREELTDEERQEEAARKQERARQRRDERIAKIKEVQKDPPEEYLRAIALEVRVGTETKNYAAIAKKEQLSGLDLQVRKLRDAITEMYQDTIYVKDREAKMRITNGNYILTSVAALLSLAVWQLCYLKAFFRTKKLIP